MQGTCVCDPAWSASPQCDVLSLLDEPNNAPFPGYHNETAASWGGNIIKENGTYHLFVAQMALECGLGQWGSNSAIVRAEATSLHGPFEYKQTIIEPFAHNPTIRKLPNGSYALYMIGGTPRTPVDCRGHSAPKYRSRYLGSTEYSGSIRISIANHLQGPWSTPVPVTFSNRSAMLYMGWTNPSPHIDWPDGTVTLAFQAHPQNTKHNWELIGVGNASSPKGPFEYLVESPVTPEKPWCIAGTDEDPFCGSRGEGFIITHGMCPTGVFQAHYKYSQDGRTWYTSPRQTYEYKLTLRKQKLLHVSTDGTPAASLCKARRDDWIF